MNGLLRNIEKILRNRRTRRKLQRTISLLAAIVVFVTTYSLVIPAITMEKNAGCGIEEHQHDDSCYEDQLICGLEESEEHQHTADCYERVLVCGKEAHTHSAACYPAETEVEVDAGVNDNAGNTDDAGDGVDTSVETTEGGETDVPASDSSDATVVIDPSDPSGQVTDGQVTDPVVTEDPAALVDDPAAAVAYPAVIFDDTINVLSAGLNTDTEIGTESGLQTLADETSLFVHVEADEETFPEGTTMVLSEVTDDTIDTVATAVEGALSAQDAAANAQQAEDASKAQTRTRGFHALDISFYDLEGNKIEPLRPVRVSITSDAIRTAVQDETTVPVVVHVEDQTAQTAVSDNAGGAAAAAGPDTALNSTVVEAAETTEAAATGRQEAAADAGQTLDTLTFEAGAFSVYAIVYTVDFHWEVDGKSYDFSIPGGGYVSLYDLVKDLGIAEYKPDTEKDEIRELVSVSRTEENTTVGAIKDGLGLECEYSADLTEKQIAEINAQEVLAGDWALISLKPFDTEESMTVTMINGETWTVKVTDAQIKTHYLSDRGDLYEIVVTYGEAAGLPDDARLEVREFDSDSTEYMDAKKTVMGNVYPQDIADSTTEDETQAEADSGTEKTETSLPGENTEDVAEVAGDIHFQAFDVSILDSDGNEVEPKAPVHVSITLQYAASEGERQSILDTLEVHHLTERNNETVSETVLPVSKTGENREIVINDETVRMEFETPSFSTYTISWYTGNSTITVRFNYKDENGNALNGMTGSESNTLNGDRNYVMADYAPVINGYEFKEARYKENSFITLRLTPNTNWYYNNYQNKWVSNGNYYNRVFFLNASGIPVYTESYTLKTNNTVDIDIVYRKKKQRKVHYGYIKNGQFIEWENERIEDIGTPDYMGDQFNARKDFQGKDYVTTRLNDPVSGVEISPLLQTEPNGFAYWKYRILDTLTIGDGINEWKTFETNDNDIYVIYRDMPTNSTDISQGDSSADPGAPATNKSFEPNNDGTYDLTLSVTGKSNNTYHKNHANVVIVLDTSSSMLYNYSGDKKEEWEIKESDLIYDKDGNNATRLKIARDAIRTFAEQLLKNNSAEDSKAVELAFVNFSHRVRNEQTMNTIYSGYGESAVNNFMTAVNTGTGNGGTNYDTAIEAANSILWDDGDPVYVAFVTDGDTVSRGYLEYNENGDSQPRDWDGGTYYDRIKNEDNSGYLKRARDAAKLQVDKLLDSGKKFYTLGVFGTVSYLKDLGGTYLGAANDETAVSSAFDRIISEIQMDLGYEGVTIHDGLTDMSTMLQVEGNAGRFRYEITTADGTVHKYDSYTALQEDYPGIGEAAYDSTNKTVIWNLGENYKLSDGVTYTVRFTVWPSQEAYDLLKEFNNKEKKITEQTTAVKKQFFVETGDNIYQFVEGKGWTTDIPVKETSTFIADTAMQGIIDSASSVTHYLRTNTSASVDYTSVKTVNGEVAEEKKVTGAEIKDPLGKMILDGTKLQMEKKWNDDLDESQLLELLTNYLNENKTDTTYTVTLRLWQDKDSIDKKEEIHTGDYKDGFVYKPEVKISNGKVVSSTWPAISVAIAPGVMVKSTEEKEKIYDSSYPRVKYGSDTYIILETGHSYEITEDDIDLHFELDTDVYHPMVVNGTLKTVKFGDDGEGNRIITEMSQDGTALTTLTATNNLKGGLDIQKFVTTKDDASDIVTSDETFFTFKIKLQKSKTDATPVYTTPGQIGENGNAKSGSLGFRVFAAPVIPSGATDIAEDLMSYKFDGLTYNASTNADGDIVSYIARGIIPETGEIKLKIRQSKLGGTEDNLLDHIRIVNMPAGTYYTVTEIDVPTGYEIVKNEGTFGTVKPNGLGTAKYWNKRTSFTIDLLKVDELDATKKLPDAEFLLYKEDGSTPAADADGKAIGTIKTGTDGKAAIGKLLPGTYKLVETVAPRGYNLMPAPITIIVTSEKVTFQQGSKQPMDAEKSSDGLTWTITATNNPGVELPATGGPGTRLFTILGTALIAGAGILLWMTRKSSLG